MDTGVNSTIKFFVKAAMIVLATSLVAVFFVDWQLVIMAAAALLILIFLIFYPVWGLYAMAACLPFYGLVFYVGPLDAPYVDVAALLTFVALAVRSLINFIDPSAFRGEYFLLKKRPAAIFALALAGAGALSLINAVELLPAIKFLLRPIIFFYLMFIVVPANTVATRSIFKRTVFIMFMAGLLAGLNAILSVLLTSGPWYVHRAQPYIMFGKNFLGGNHNAVAEVLAGVIPFGAYLFFNADKMKTKGWYLLALGAAAGVLLMTFSRSGWIALALEALVFLIFFFGGRVKKSKLLAGILLAAMALSVFYIGVWSKAEWIKSSDSSRLLMADVAWTNFLAHPIVGNGLNSFPNLLGSTFVYYVEFDEPLDSHGFIQKLLSETGVLGLAAYSALLIWVGWRLWLTYTRAEGKDRLSALCFIAVFCGLVGFELFSTSYFQARLWLPIGLALTWSIEKTKDQSEKKLSNIKFQL